MLLKSDGPPASEVQVKFVARLGSAEELDGVVLPGLVLLCLLFMMPLLLSGRPERLSPCG